MPCVLQKPMLGCPRFTTNSKSGGNTAATASNNQLKAATMVVARAMAIAARAGRGRAARATASASTTVTMAMTVVVMTANSDQDSKRPHSTTINKGNEKSAATAAAQQWRWQQQRWQQQRWRGQRRQAAACGHFVQQRQSTTEAMTTVAT
jgi:hypothetical protein